MPDNSSPRFGIKPWVEGPEVDEYTVTVNVMMWLVLPLVYALLMWGGLWLLYFPVDLGGFDSVRQGVRILLGPLAFIFVVFFFIIAPRFILRDFQLNRLSARLRVFILGAFPGRVQLVLFHALVCALLFAAIVWLGLYMLDARDAATALAAGWRRPLELLGGLGRTLVEIGWLKLFALAYLYLLLFWLVEEIVFAFRSEISPTRAEKVASFQAPRSAAPVATVAHLTDLHVTATDETARVDGGPGGNLALRRALEELGGREADEVSAVLITGDMTDGGRAAEWRRFFDIVPADLLEKCVLVPGNHELNIPEGDGLRAAIEPQEQVER
ncbi:MAG TPA: metallophosphoesterase, partial [Pyrinomonadaceae bacterium]|nr:metallophosphoesterase [Pyrinomonadaceae bacterium]